MAGQADDFRTLMDGVLAGHRAAAEAFCRYYQSHILRVVRRRLSQRMRNRYDSLDFVHDVWASFFAKPPQHLQFNDPQALIAYLERMAQYKVGEEVRRQAGKVRDTNRELPLEPPHTDPDRGLPARQPTPSQIVGAEDEWERLLHGQPPMHQRILHLLRQGLSQTEIAAQLQTNERTIRRLVRRLQRASEA
jgi:RNA polymerase sigma-70 factor (ECF subfamily)